MRIVAIIFLLFLMVANQNGTACASLQDKNCEDLNISKLRDGDQIAYTNDVFSLAKTIFDIDLSLVSDSEIDILNGKIVACKENNPDFLGNISIKYIGRIADGVCKAFRNKRNEAKERVEAMSAQELLGKQSTDIISKIDNGNATASDIEILGTIATEAEELYKKHNYQYSDFKTISSESQYAINKYKQRLLEIEREKIKQESLLEAQKEQEQQKQDKLEESIEIYASYAGQNLGPTEKFFMSQFQTYAGNGASGDLCSVIKYYHKLQGTKSWVQNPNTLVWVLTNEFSNFKGEQVIVEYYFVEATKDKGQITKGMIWLEGITINGTDYPYMNLVYFILEQLSN